MENVFKIFNLSDDTQLKLNNFLNIFMEWNSKINLSGTKERDKIIEEHFIDSMFLVNFLKSGKVIDIGSGGGFPGIILSIVKPDIQFTLVESIKKKTMFLENVKKILNLENLNIINERAEFLNQNLKNMFDYGLARAVGKVNQILEYVIPYIKKDGIFLMQKGLSFSDELKNSKNAFSILKSEIISLDRFELPISKKERVIISVKKNEMTDPIFPRKPSLISNKPL